MRAHGDVRLGHPVPFFELRALISPRTMRVRSWHKPCPTAFFVSIRFLAHHTLFGGKRHVFLAAKRAQPAGTALMRQSVERLLPSRNPLEVLGC
jgi:hypothetical protein